MGKAKIPVSIAGLEFDALLSEEQTLTATVPEYSVEEGYSVTDSIILGSEPLNMTLFVTNTPVTWHKRHGSSPNRVKEVETKLKAIFFKKQPVTIVTTDTVYKNMAIESIAFNKSADVGYAREIPISFKKIRITTAKTTTIPSHYGKSGKTGTSAGTASTSTGSSGSGSGNSGSSGSNSNSKDKSSILYNVASSIGILK